MEGNNLIKKGIALAVILLFFSVSVIPSTGINMVEKSSTVSFDGNTLYVGGSGEGNYTKIQDAIDNASNGDTVFVYNASSPYYETVDIDKTINLIGEDKNTTIIDGSGSGYIEVVALRASGISINGFTIKGAGRHTLYILSHDNIVTGNVICYASLCGIWIVSENNIIYHNTVKNNHRSGIAIRDGGGRNQILENDITYNEKGISLWTFNDRNVVVGNTITNNGYGIMLHGNSFRGASHNEIYHNRFIDNGVNAYEHTYCFRNKFDNGIFSGGNYWDDYKEKYPNAVPRPTRPWIWSTPYKIYDDEGEFQNRDCYPLVNKSMKSMVHPTIINSLFLLWFLERFPVLSMLLYLIK